MNRRPAALVAAWMISLAGLTLVGPATPVALGHSQLVTSIPAAGDVVATSPTSIELVFSEPIDGAYTRIDVLDATGKAVDTGIGAPDPSDPHSLIAPIAPLPDGLYTVDWRALSAADGHTTSGFFTFGVGNVTPPPASSSASDPGSIHAGHDAATAFLETESRIVGDLGFLLAAGLPVIAVLVLRWWRAANLARLTALALALGAIGAGGLIVLGATGVSLDPLAYVADSRAGQLLAARAVIGIVGSVVVGLLARRRSRVALVLAAIGGLAGLVLVAMGGHAAAYDSPAPAAAVVVHLVSAGIWLAGILALAWLAIAGTSDGPPLSVLVPRFSALALVTVGLVVLTGIYSDWIETRALISLDTAYGTTLAVKAGLALAAFSIGALNYFSGGRGGDRRFRPRIVIEAGFAIGVLVATGVLASGSPPAQEQPVAIAPVPSSVPAQTAPPTLELAPGRPGPTRFVVTLPAAPPPSTTVELQLQDLATADASSIPLRPDPVPNVFEASGGLIRADSQWDASVVLRRPDGTEVSRTRFSFAMDSEGVSVGRTTPPIDPAIVIGVILLVAAALGLSFALAGGALPRVEPAASRIATLGGSAIAIVLGSLVLFGGPRL